MAGAAEPRRVGGSAEPMSGQYLVSTDAGIFLTKGADVILLSNLPTYGIAIADGYLYAASLVHQRTMVVVSRDRVDFSQPAAIAWRELYSETVRTAAGRFHQIGIAGNALWIANTARNALTKIDRKTGAWQAGICPFVCGYGHPIDGDHNHVNSVFPQERYLIFTAFKIFKQGAIGLMGEGQILLFGVPNMGIHDCIIADDEFWYSDTLRKWDGVGHGSVYCDGNPIDDAYLATHGEGFIRGIAGDDRELLIGSSHFADIRPERGRGQGYLLRGRDGRFEERLSIPAAQIFDILRTDGRHFASPPRIKSFRDARRKLKAVLGEPLQTLSISDCFVGPAAKKFDETDIGDVPEYTFGEATTAVEHRPGMHALRPRQTSRVSTR